MAKSKEFLRKERKRLKGYGKFVSDDRTTLDHMGTVPQGTAYGGIIGGSALATAAAALGAKSKYGMTHTILDKAGKATGHRGIKAAAKTLEGWHVALRTIKSDVIAAAGVSSLRSNPKVGKFLIKNRVGIAKALSKFSRASAAAGIGFGVGRAVGRVVGGFKPRVTFQDTYGGHKGSIKRAINTSLTNHITRGDSESDAAYAALLAYKARTGDGDGRG